MSVMWSYTQSMGLLGRGSGSRKAATYRTARSHSKHTQIFMSRVGFEPTIAVFFPAKTLQVFDRAAIGIGSPIYHRHRTLRIIIVTTLMIMMIMTRLVIGGDNNNSMFWKRKYILLLYHKFRIGNFCKQIQTVGYSYSFQWSRME
jgi:hypothetical protein